MNHHYKDIRDKLGIPQWFDEHAVPRYKEFHPTIVANIYAKEVALVLIACQSCSHPFKVAMSWPFDLLQSGDTLEESIEVGELWYSDPPNIQCCPAGPTMTSITHKVLEFWRLDYNPYRWIRIPSLEIDLYDPSEWEWSEDDDGV